MAHVHTGRSLLLFRDRSCPGLAPVQGESLRLFDPLLPHLLCLLLLLSACTAASDPDLLVDYTRSGGLMGRTETLRVERSGAVTLASGDRVSECSVDAATIEQLVAALESPGFAGLRADYPAARGADLMEYRVRTAEHRVTAYDTTIPDELVPVLDLLEGIRASCG